MLKECLEIYEYKGGKKKSKTKKLSALVGKTCFDLGKELDTC